jgi:hypothetical protein
MIFLVAQVLCSPSEAHRKDRCRVPQVNLVHHNWVPQTSAACLGMETPGGVYRARRRTADLSVRLPCNRRLSIRFGAGVPRSKPSVLKSSSMSGQWIPYPPTANRPSELSSRGARAEASATRDLGVGIVAITFPVLRSRNGDWLGCMHQDPSRRARSLRSFARLGMTIQ